MSTIITPGDNEKDILSKRRQKRLDEYTETANSLVTILKLSGKEISQHDLMQFSVMNLLSFISSVPVDPKFESAVKYITATYIDIDLHTESMEAQIQEDLNNGILPFPKK